MNDRSRALIDQLISETKLYSRADALKELLDFTSRLRHIAPFNLMLLHVQKPGLSYAATAKDWFNRFHCTPKPHARPLVILRNFGPVEFVFDVLDVTPDVPEAAYSFPTKGNIVFGWISGTIKKLSMERIEVTTVQYGDYKAGQVKMLIDFGDPSQKNKFELVINNSHPENIQFVTLMHELAHIYLGHCGADAKRGIKARTDMEKSQKEVEAETVAYVIAKRSGISPKSEKYLENYSAGFEKFDVHAVLHAAGQIEKLLGLPLIIWPGDSNLLI